MPRNKWQWKHNDPKTIGHNKSNFKKEACINSISLQRTRKVSNKLSNLTHKATRERRTKKTQRQWKEIIYKYHSRNKWHRNEKNNSKHQ